MPPFLCEAKMKVFLAYMILVAATLLIFVLSKWLDKKLYGG